MVNNTLLQLDVEPSCNTFSAYMCTMQADSKEDQANQEAGGEPVTTKLTVILKGPERSSNDEYEGASQKSKASAKKPLCCQVDGCGVDLTQARKYFQRYRVCERHLKAPILQMVGRSVRFCDQCSRFHDISMFQGNRRTCNEKLERTRIARSDKRRQLSEQTRRARARLKGLPGLQRRNCDDDDDGDDYELEAAGITLALKRTRAPKSAAGCPGTAKQPQPRPTQPPQTTTPATLAGPTSEPETGFPMSMAHSGVRIVSGIPAAMHPLLRGHPNDGTASSISSWDDGYPHLTLIRTHSISSQPGGIKTAQQAATGRTAAIHAAQVPYMSLRTDTAVAAAVGRCGVQEGGPAGLSPTDGGDGAAGGRQGNAIITFPSEREQRRNLLVGEVAPKPSRNVYEYEYAVPSSNAAMGGASMRLASRSVVPSLDLHDSRMAVLDRSDRYPQPVVREGNPSARNANVRQQEDAVLVVRKAVSSDRMAPDGSYGAGGRQGHANEERASGGVAGTVAQPQQAVRQVRAGANVRGPPRNGGDVLGAAVQMTSCGMVPAVLPYVLNDGQWYGNNSSNNNDNSLPRKILNGCATLMAAPDAGAGSTAISGRDFHSCWDATAAAAAVAAAEDSTSRPANSAGEPTAVLLPRIPSSYSSYGNGPSYSNSVEIPYHGSNSSTVSGLGNWPGPPSKNVTSMAEECRNTAARGLISDHVAPVLDLEKRPSYQPPVAMEAAAPLRSPGGAAGPYASAYASRIASCSDNSTGSDIMRLMAGVRTPPTSDAGVDATTAQQLLINLLEQQLQQQQPRGSVGREQRVQQHRPLGWACGVQPQQEAVTEATTEVGGRLYGSLKGPGRGSSKGEKPAAAVDDAAVDQQPHCLHLSHAQRGRPAPLQDVLLQLVEASKRQQGGVASGPQQIQQQQPQYQYQYHAERQQQQQQPGMVTECGRQQSLAAQELLSFAVGYSNAMGVSNVCQQQLQKQEQKEQQQHPQQHHHQQQQQQRLWESQRPMDQMTETALGVASTARDRQGVLRNSHAAAKVPLASSSNLQLATAAAVSERSNERHTNQAGGADVLHAIQPPGLGTRSCGGGRGKAAAEGLSGGGADLEEVREEAYACLAQLQHHLGRLGMQLVLK